MLKYKGIRSNEASISLQTLNMCAEFLNLCRSVICSASITPQLPLQSSWMPPEYRTLMVNNDVAFSKGKVGISILVCNHLGIPLIEKSIPHNGCTAIDYGEILGIIEGYTVGIDLFVLSGLFLAVLLICLSLRGWLLVFFYRLIGALQISPM